MTDARAEQILHEWFGDLDERGRATSDKEARWWRKDPDFDAYLRRTYEDDVQRALAGELDGWAATPRGTLALVILLDQIPRNIYRGTGAMYRGDPRALEVVDAALARGDDAVLVGHERQFLYMPLMHAEDLAAQERCVALFERLRDEAGIDAKDFAVRHRDIVARFGRFPHRNDLLGRETTPEEAAFLEEPGSSF